MEPSLLLRTDSLESPLLIARHRLHNFARKVWHFANLFLHVCTFFSLIYAIIWPQMSSRGLKLKCLLKFNRKIWLLFEPNEALLACINPCDVDCALGFLKLKLVSAFIWWFEGVRGMWANRRYHSLSPGSCYILVFYYRFFCDRWL